MAMFDLGKRSTSQEPARSEEPMDGLDSVFNAQSTPQQQPSPAVRRRDAAVVGPSIHIEGTLRGEEDLIIEGHVSGTVQLQGNTLTIGSQGKVEADLHAQTVFVDGSVEGDIYGSDLVAIRKNARVIGNVSAPRVSLEDGARFKGSIEMDVRKESTGKPASTSTPATAPRAEAAKPGAGASGVTSKDDADKKDNLSAKGEASKGGATG
ncbi:MAG: polymer-forming cytoskeletal protein [Ectothiorhodospiraceae bacterium]|nr:polymer-forming cytoskeletal protein [Ectothiorhodospiraceae bacterium]